MRARLVLGLALGLALGCGSGQKFAPVSGKVTLDGQPLAGATVSLQPIAPEGSAEAGPGSAGKTNEKGEYTLTGDKGQKGALVGKHRVVITCLRQQAGDGDARPPRGGWPLADKVPARYNSSSHETFEVPAGGTDKADFNLSSK
ncbi:MAG TPA: hypothetical protein VFW33_19755 [Gemmataceae bacterium]|nr:hypothetical protein [Gemmataceae bacterium]